MRFARRTDANLKAIVAAYRQLGCRVDVTNDKWDLTVQWGGVTDLVEVKDGSKPPSARKLTKAEEKTHETLMIRTVLNINQVYDHVQYLRQKQVALMRAYLGDERARQVAPCKEETWAT